MAELLVWARGHWLDDTPQDKIDAMTNDELVSFNARIQKGDVVVVRPDGWEWGALECPPDFIVIKVPDMKFEDAQLYEQSLTDNTNQEKSVTLKIRKYAIDPSVVDGILNPLTGGGKLGTKYQMDVSASAGVADMTMDDLATNIITKDS